METLESNKTFDIVRLGPEDWQKIAALRARSLSEEPNAFTPTPAEEAHISESEWRKRLEDGEYFVAKQGDALVGMVCALRDKRERKRHIVSLKGVFVVPEARGKGIARALLETAMREKVAEGGVVKFELGVTSTQDAAAHLYESLGFKRIGTQEKEVLVDGKYLDAHLMEKIVG